MGVIFFKKGSADIRKTLLFSLWLREILVIVEIIINEMFLLFLQKQHSSKCINTNAVKYTVLPLWSLEKTLLFTINPNIPKGSNIV